MARLSFWIVTALVACISLAFADDIDPNAKAAYYVDVDRKYVVGLNFVEETGDIWCHMSAPSSAQWFGVGIGASMTNSFMIVAYATANGTGVTTSPRYSTGHSEPVWRDGVVLEKIWSDSYGPNSNMRNPSPKGISISHTVCRNCTRFVNIDFRNQAQPFIFAVGPKRYMGSDQMDAGLRLHAFHGVFTMNMSAATNYTGNYGRVPAPNHNTDEDIKNGGTFLTANATLVSFGNDRDVAPIAHGVCMLLAFVIIFPLGAVGMRILRSMLWHIVAQSLGIVFVIAGVVMGVKTSREYNYTKNFNNTHQTLGTLLMALLLLQVGIGLTHHMLFRSRQKKAQAARSPAIGSSEEAPRPFPINKFHMIMGPIIILLALINGGLGFQLADNSSMYGPYGGVVAAFILALLGLRCFVGLYRAPARYSPEDPDEVDYFTQSPGGFAPFQQSPHVGWTDDSVPMTPAPYDRNGLPYSPRTPPAVFSQWYNNYPASPVLESRQSSFDGYQHFGFRDLKTESSREELLPIPERPEKSAKSDIKVYTRPLD